MSAGGPEPGFLTGANATFIGDLHARWVRDPNAVDPAWAEFFAGLADGGEDVLRHCAGPSWAPRAAAVWSDGDLLTEAEAEAEAETAPAAGGAAVVDDAAVRARTLDSIRALMLIRSYRVRGHLLAKLDPLELSPPASHPELDYRTYGFTDDDLDRVIFIDNVLGLETATLGQIVERVQKTYCGTIGVEYMHIQEPDQKAWIQERIESIENRTDFTQRGRRAIYERMVAAESFELFLDRKYTGTKRFGLDGAESTIPGLEQIMKRGGQLGLQEIVIGMPHRGRLNVLANMMGKPFQAIFSEFQGGSASPDDVQGSGDVKYHLGTSSDREFDGNMVHLSLTANPSHLEAVNPVVLGKVRAKQTQRTNEDRDQVMALLLHGDAAFAGQGLVPESLELSELRGYRTGGTIHFVVNNQIGFTTMPAAHRSGPYCSEVGKIVQAPIFHVNGDDPEAVVHVSRIAMEFRQQFRKDVVIDMFCYRRHGHNEGDEPMFTQPHMYKAIAGHPTSRQLYGDRLVADGVLTREEADRIVSDFEAMLEAEFEAAGSYRPNKADWLEGVWTGLETARGEARRGDTAMPVERLREIGAKLCEVPEGFALNSKINRFLNNRRRALESGEGIDWALGEALAFGSLLAEGTPVRMSGQDCGRGTFSQRHAVLVDQENEKKLVSLDNVDPDQAMFEIMDSPLSEAGVLGFEYGYSLAEPNILVLWEAQFGDFANGAQVIIDQFISSGESKWLRMSGLVLLLPHGYEGQGPEHSSARLERYLQLCAEDNIQVVNCTTPSSYFHVLRRQIRREFRKPLVVMTPKSLLRHKQAVSTLDEMSEGTNFHRVLHDNEVLCPDSEVRRVVMCSGKVYYDLLEERRQRGQTDVFFLRFEQLYPFPFKALGEELSRFPDAEMVWCQEEPKNMGAWSFVAPLIEEVLVGTGASHARPVYAGRAAAASPATGLMTRHKAEQAALLDEALTVAGPAAGKRGKRGNGGKKN